jgi:integrase-like protein
VLRRPDAQARLGLLVKPSDGDACQCNPSVQALIALYASQRAGVKTRAGAAGPGWGGWWALKDSNLRLPPGEGGREAGRSANGLAMLLSDFALDFLTFSSKRLKPSTLLDYRYCLNTHVIPHLGSKHLHSITTKDIVALQSAMAATPARANRAVNITLRMLRVASMLGYKVRPVERPRLFTETKRQRYLDKKKRPGC